MFKYGASAEGYWTYDRMIFQLEECIEYLKVLHPQYDFVFLFNHSCGHEYGQDIGTNANQANVGFIRKQPKMHNTLIKEEAGYLGQFKGSIRTGDVQDMVCPVYEDKDFDPEQHRPYHITP